MNNEFNLEEALKDVSKVQYSNGEKITAIYFLPEKTDNEFKVISISENGGAKWHNINGQYSITSTYCDHDLIIKPLIEKRYMNYYDSEKSWRNVGNSYHETLESANSVANNDASRRVLCFTYIDGKLKSVDIIK